MSSELHLIEPTKDDWMKTATYVGTYAVAVVLSTFLLVPHLWFIWVLIVVGGLVALVYWHTRTFGYRCSYCQHEFTLSFFQNLISPQGFKNGKGWKHVHCPHCQDKSGALVLKKLQ